MFFTKIGKVIAHLVFWLGLMRLFSAFFTASIDDVSARIAATKTYLGADSLGKEIDQISISLLIAVVLGVLCEISCKKP